MGDEPEREGDATADWRPVVAALANREARAVWAHLVAGGSPGDAGLGAARERRALALLESTGLAHREGGDWAADDAVFRRLLASAAAAQPRPQGVARFLRPDGRIDRYPAGAGDRLQLLTHVAESVLQPGETVGERELTGRLSALSDDPVSLRRYLVDAGLLLRTRSGSEYGRPASA